MIQRMRYIWLCLRLMALSNCQGIFVAPKTRTPVSSCPTPFICTKNSVLILRDPSDSDSLRELAKESISSMKIIAGFDSRANWNRFFTNLISIQQMDFSSRAKTDTTHLSESPCHLLTRSLELTLKNVLFASVATAFAKYDFPVPGGPYRRIPLHGVRLPVNR